MLSPCALSFSALRTRSRAQVYLCRQATCKKHRARPGTLCNMDYAVLRRAYSVYCPLYWCGRTIYATQHQIDLHVGSLSTCHGGALPVLALPGAGRVARSARSTESESDRCQRRVIRGWAVVSRAQSGPSSSSWTRCCCCCCCCRT